MRNECRYNPNEYFVECVCCNIEHVFNIVLGKETGTTFPISVQDKEVNALLDTGAEKSCMSMDMFARLKLPFNVGKLPKLRNASGRDIKTHGVMTTKFKMGNTIFIQEFVVHDNLVRPIIIGRDFTVNNFIGIAWTRQGTKKVTKDDKIVIEIEEPMRKKTLTMTRKVTIPPRSYAVFDVEGKEWEGKYEIRPNPFLKQREPNLWTDNLMLYNIQGKENGIEPKDRIETQVKRPPKAVKVMILQKDVLEGKKNQKRYIYPTVFLILAMNIIAIFPKVVW